MTSTQTSFSAFAAAQTASFQSLAVPDEPGRRGCLPSFPYPLPEFSFNEGHFTGDPAFFELRDGYSFREIAYCLDASQCLPDGGHRSFEFGRTAGYFYVVAFGASLRG